MNGRKICLLLAKDLCGVEPRGEPIAMAGDGSESGAGGRAVHQRLNRGLNARWSQAESREAIRYGDRAGVKTANHAIARRIEDHFAMLKLEATAEFGLLGEGNGRSSVGAGASGNYQRAGGNGKRAARISDAPTSGHERAAEIFFIHQRLLRASEELVRERKLGGKPIAEEVVFNVRLRLEGADDGHIVQQFVGRAE